MGSMVFAALDVVECTLLTRLAFIWSLTGYSVGGVSGGLLDFLIG